MEKQSTTEEQNLVEEAAPQQKIAAVALGYPLSSSSEWDANHSVHRARLDYPPPQHGASAWIASQVDLGQWIGVNFLAPKTVVAVETQGRGNKDQWVTHYVVKYSLDGIDWFVAEDCKEFVGNSDQNTRVVQDFQQPFKARAVRICPTQYHNWISMRFEVYFLDK